MNNNERESFGITSNIVTGTIMQAIIFLIAAGTVIALLGPSQDIILGLLVAGLGFILLVTGYTEHPADPPTWGLIIRSGKPWVIGGRSIAVKGIVYLCNWPLVWITTVKIQATWEEMIFPTEILSRDRIPMTVEIRIMGMPDRDELHLFINNGKDHEDRWKYIKEEIKGIVENVAKNQTFGQNYIDIMQNAQELSENVGKTIYEERPDGKNKLREKWSDGKTLFGNRTFGIIIGRVQLNSSLPANIVTSMTERAARQIEYDADIAAAKKVLTASKKAGVTLTLEQALDKVNTMRRIRDQKDSRLDIVTSGDGNVGTVILQGANINTGGNKK